MDCISVKSRLQKVVKSVLHYAGKNSQGILCLALVATVQYKKDSEKLERMQSRATTITKDLEVTSYKNHLKELAVFSLT